MPKNKAMNMIKMVAFLFVLTICIALFGPYIIPNINVGLLMLFDAEFWTLFFFIAGIWFIFGMIMWMRGFGKKGESQ